jgi:hypothetical protein
MKRSLLDSGRLSCSRYYLWPETDPPQRLPVGFLTGKNRYPQFANTRQRYVEVSFDGDGIWPIVGSHIAFDADGGWDRREIARLAGNLMVLYQEKKQRVPQLDVVRDASREVAKVRWQITDADLEKIGDDLTGKHRISFAKGIRSRHQPLIKAAECSAKAK